jgi:hypothetical protein
MTRSAKVRSAKRRSAKSASLLPASCFSLPGSRRFAGSPLHPYHKEETDQRIFPRTPTERRDASID